MDRSLILPDSRSRETKGMVFGSGGAYIPIHCANCGVHAGWCPEGTNFLFYLCNGCVDKYGPVAGTMMMPDEVFYARLAEEQIQSHGRYLTQDELAKVIEDDNTPLATLLKEAT